MSATSLVTPDASELGVSRKLNGARVVDVAEATLRTGEEMVAYWTRLEPVVNQLVTLVQQRVTSKAMDRLSPSAAANLLATVSNVVDKMAKAGQAVLKASEGQARLHVLLTGGPRQRPDAGALSERQAANVVIEAVRRLKADSGVCPICAPPVIEAEVAECPGDSE